MEAKWFRSQLRKPHLPTRPQRRRKLTEEPQLVGQRPHDYRPTCRCRTIDPRSQHRRRISRGDPLPHRDQGLAPRLRRLERGRTLQCNNTSHAVHEYISCSTSVISVPSRLSRTPVMCRQYRMIVAYSSDGPQITARKCGSAPAHQMIRFGAPCRSIWQRRETVQNRAAVDLAIGGLVLGDVNAPQFVGPSGR